MKWREVLELIPPDESVPGFRIHYRHRDLWPGPGCGVRGISGDALLKAYSEGLRTASERLSAQRTAKPATPIPVYIFHIPDAADTIHKDMKYGWPFAWTGTKQPCIGLPSRTKETDLDAAMSRARVEAAHELTHLFNAVPQRDYESMDRRWNAVDEATAVYMERRIFPGVRSTLNYASEWIDFPERSLFDDGCRQSWLFLEYLSGKDPDFVTKLWNDTPRAHGVVEAIERLTGRPLRDTFAEYAADSYFTSGLCPDVHPLHNPNRASKHSGDLAPCSPSEYSSERLDHLACHYYRFRTGGLLKHLRANSVRQAGAAGCVSQRVRSGNARGNANEMQPDRGWADGGSTRAVVLRSHGGDRRQL